MAVDCWTRTASRLLNIIILPAHSNSIRSRRTGLRTQLRQPGQDHLKCEALVRRLLWRARQRIRASLFFYQIVGASNSGCSTVGLEVTASFFTHIYFFAGTESFCVPRFGLEIGTSNFFTTLNQDMGLDMAVVKLSTVHSARHDACPVIIINRIRHGPGGLQAEHSPRSSTVTRPEPQRHHLGRHSTNKDGV
jgi:hypothetical protein